ncbi:MAG: recombination regulator RecX [Spirochaetaceae bacterium]|jgi:regulatory protein|nr:recombination regulator RecX [Spirochaetaceae bacterium]
MTIISLKTGTDPELIRVGLSDGSLFSLRTSYLENRTNLDENSEISAASAGDMRFAASCYRAEKAALNLIARAEQCAFGLAAKLEKRGHDQVCIREVMARLEGLGIVDDRRFAERWLGQRLSRSADTPLGLKAKLCRRGIAPRTAGEALKSCLSPETEAKLLERYLRKKTRSPASKTRYGLYQGGFSPAVLALYFQKK